MARNFRELFRWLLPSRLRNGEGGLVAYSLATMKDIYLERVRQGLVARFPSTAADDALIEIGAERGIKRGRSTRERYVERLKAWRYPRGHRCRGSAFAALNEISEQFGQVECRSIDTKGNEHTHDADGTETYTYRQRWTWDVAEAPDAQLDPAAGTDVGDILIGPGTGTLTLHCDGTPGRLIFLHIASTEPTDTVSLPPEWVLVIDHQQAGVQAYREYVYWRLVEADDAPFTTVTVTCTNAGVVGGNHRFIGRAINVTASTRFASNPIFAAAGGTTGAGTGGTITPTLPHGGKALALFFATSRVTTYDFSGMHNGVTELGAERTAGTTGVGIAEAKTLVDWTDAHDGAEDVATLTLGTSFTFLTAYVVVVQQPAPKARFWVEVQNAANANAYSGLSGDLWTAPGAETLGMAGMTPREATDLRDLFNVAPRWKPAGTRAEWAIINLQGIPIDPEPSWQNWSEPRLSGGVTTQTATRASWCRYISLYGGRRYAGRTDVFVTRAPLLNGTLEPGDPENVAAFAAQTLPISGAAYAGNDANFAVNVRLPDDGDLPE